MNYVKCTNKYALLELQDSQTSEHQPLVEEIVFLIQRKFKIFVLDFGKVEKFNSHILALTLGILKAISNEEARLFVMNLSSYALSMLELSGTVADYDRHEEIFKELNTSSMREITIKRRFKP